MPWHMSKHQTYKWCMSRALPGPIRGAPERKGERTFRPASAAIGRDRKSAISLRRSPADAHHLRFTQPRAMGRKVSDEFTVPLCRTHHRDNHRFGDDEAAWWGRQAIDPVGMSRKLWVS